MPFRYVKGENGESIMPEVRQNWRNSGSTMKVKPEADPIQGMVDLIKRDSEKGFGDLF
jgi:hypothetical protein